MTIDNLIGDLDRPVDPEPVKRCRNCKHWALKAISDYRACHLECSSETITLFNGDHACHRPGDFERKND